MSAGGRRPNNRITMDLPSQSISFDSEAFNEFLNTQGVRLVHHKALRCPVGMTDVDDNRQPHADHEGCSNGFIYYKAGIVTGAMQGNSNSQSSGDLGFTESTYITVSFPQYYDGTTDKISMAPFDRFYLDESEPEARITVPTWHLVTAHQSRMDKLYYPAVSVEKLVDFRGIEYKEGQDFCIHDGQIKWLGNWPGYQLDVGRGAIYSIRYSYRPHWYLTRLLHEVRVAQIDTLDGRVLMRMPQQALLCREFVHTNSSTSENADSSRQAPEPTEGGWGSPK